MLDEGAELLVVEAFGERGVADEIDEPDGGLYGPRKSRLAPGKLAPQRGPQLEAMHVVDEADQLGDVVVREAGPAGVVDRAGHVVALGVGDPRQRGAEHPGLGNRPLDRPVVEPGLREPFHEDPEGVDVGVRERWQVVGKVGEPDGAPDRAGRVEIGASACRELALGVLARSGEHLPVEDEEGQVPAGRGLVDLLGAGALPKQEAAKPPVHGSTLRPTAGRPSTGGPWSGRAPWEDRAPAHRECCA